MALSALQTQSIYEAVGLFAGGTDRFRVRFNAFSTQDIEQSSLNWDYSTAKTTIDTRLAALVTAEETRLGTFVDVWDETVTSSFKLEGEVKLDDDDENTKAAKMIRQVVGFWLEPVPFVAPDGFDDNPRQGRVTR